MSGILTRIMDDSLKGFNSMGIKMESVSELHDQLNYPDLTGMAGNDMYNGLFLPDETGDPDKGGGGSSALAGANGEEDDEEEDLDDVIILHLDIQQPIKHLRKMLEQRIGVNLRNYEFWLQDAQMVGVVGVCFVLSLNNYNVWPSLSSSRTRISSTSASRARVLSRSTPRCAPTRSASTSSTC